MIHRDSSKETLTGHHVFIESNIRVSCNRSQHPTLGMISWDVRWCSPLECLQYAVLATHVSPLDVPFRNTPWTTLRCQHGGPAGKSPNYFNGNIIQLNLVGGFNPSEKYSSVRIIFPNLWKDKKMFGTSWRDCPLPCWNIRASLQVTHCKLGLLMKHHTLQKREWPEPSWFH